MAELLRNRIMTGASWRERRGLQQMQQALSRLQRLQHQEHGRCRLLSREFGSVAKAVARWSAYRETVIAAARPDLLGQVDAELARWRERQQEAEQQLASQRELLATLDARVSALQQRFLAIGERWPQHRPTAPASAQVWRELQRYEQQFVSAERCLPALPVARTPMAVEQPAVDVLAPPVSTDAARQNGQGGTAS